MRHIFLAAFFALALVASPALAEFRVAFVDVSKVLNESKEAQSLKKKLDDMSTSARKKLDARKAVLKEMEGKLKGVSEDSKEAEDFRNQVRDFDRMVRDTQEDLKKEFMKSNKELTDKALGLVKKYAIEKKFDLVLDRSDASRGPVLYAGAVLDITPEVISGMNR